MKDYNYLPKNKNLKTNSRKLRSNATPHENKLWYEFLKYYPVQFKRQYIIGNYISDFYCHKARLIVELDGGQHFEEEAQIKDAERDAYFEGLGIRVLRFPNCDIDSSFYEVCTVIDLAVKERMNK